MSTTFFVVLMKFKYFQLHIDFSWTFWTKFLREKLPVQQKCPFDQIYFPVFNRADLPFMISWIFLLYQKEKTLYVKLQFLRAQKIDFYSDLTLFVFCNLLHHSKLHLSDFFYKIKDSFSFVEITFFVLKHFIFKELSYFKYNVHNRITASSKLGYFSVNQVIKTRTYIHSLDLLVIL